MGIIMEISNKPTRMYKVIYENIKTFQQFTIIVESSSAYEASESVLKNVGEEMHDILITQLVKPNELN